MGPKQSALAFASALCAMTCGCDSNWQGAEVVDDRPHFAAQDPQPATAIAGTRAVVVWNREIASALPSTDPLRHTWARVHDGTSWSAFVDLGSDTRYPQVAGSADGSAIALVSDGAVRYDSGGWSAPTALPLGRDPSVAMDARGNAIVVGSADARTHAIFFDPATGWADPVDIGESGSQYRVDMSETGMAVAAWCQGSEVWASVYRLSGTWSGAEHVLDGCVPGSTGLVFGTTALDVAMAGTGEAHVASAGPLGISVSTYSPLSGFGSASFAELGAHLSFPQLGANSAGNVLLAWTDAADNWAMRARYFRPGVGWAGPFTVAPSSNYTRKGVWLDDSGKGQIVYIARDGRTNVYASEFDGASLSFAGAVLIESLGDISYYLSATGAANGYGVAAWDAGRPSGTATEQIWAVRHVP